MSYHIECPQCGEQLYVKAWVPQDPEAWPVCSAYGADMGDVEDSSTDHFLTRVCCVEGNCGWVGTLDEIAVR